MTHIKIKALVAAAFALTLTVQEANSASFNATGALKENAVGTNLLQKAYGCHTNCLWEWQQVHRMPSQHLVMRFRVALQPEGLPLVALVALRT